MSEPEDMAFLVKREQKYRELAAVPGDVVVQLAHHGMAEGYAARISAMKTKLI